MKETELRIRVFGDPALRKRSSTVRDIGDKQRKILNGMAQLMYEEGGIGLAAPQVGVGENMIVVDIGSGLYKLINPKMLKKEGRQSNEEGCLSIPGVCIKVSRAASVLVKAQDENGKESEIEAEGLLACVLQHEIDHLKAKLIVDYASFLDKIKIGRRLEEIKKRSLHEKLPQSETKSCQLQL